MNTWKTMKESTSLKRYFNWKRWDWTAVWNGMIVPPQNIQGKRLANSSTVKPIKVKMNNQSNSNPCLRGQSLWLNWSSIHPLLLNTWLDLEMSSDTIFAPQKRVKTLWWNWRKYQFHSLWALLSDPIRGKTVEMGLDPTRPTFWPSVHKGLTRPWPGYCLTWPEGLFVARSWLIKLCKKVDFF